jgi:colanic acid/amylovoran biosynthesis protein
LISQEFVTANNQMQDPVRFSKPVCCILGASFGTRNLGVSALAASTVASILHSFPDAKIFLLDYAKTSETFQVRHEEGVAEVELVNIRFSWRIYLRNNIARLILTVWLLKLIPFKRVRERLISRNPYLKRIHDADLICSLAGGDSFSDIYGLRRFFYVTLPQLLVLFLNRPLMLLPQTLGPFNGTIARKVAAFILRHADRVYARDRESGLEVGPMIEGRIAGVGFSYDMAFLLKPFAPANEPEWLKRVSVGNRPLVGLNVSGLLYHGGYTGKNMFGLKADYAKLVRRIIQFFIEEKGAHVALVPHVFGAPNDLDSDPVASATLYKELQKLYPDRLHLVEGEYDQHEIKYLIGKCDFFLGSRMHACIAALSQSIPAIGLAYSKKFVGVLRTIGAENLVVDLRQNSTEEIISLIDSAYTSRESIRRDLASRMTSVKKDVATLFARTDRTEVAAPISRVSKLAMGCE